MYGGDLPEVVTERLERELQFDYFQWVRRNVYHCPKAGVEVQSGMGIWLVPEVLSDLPLFATGGNYRGKSAEPALLL